jgi:alkylation response protein AidB-like acyl-CoA dehydrogenase
MRDRKSWHPVLSVVSTFAFPIFIAPYAGIAEEITEKTIEMFSGRPKSEAHSAAKIGEMHNHFQITRMALDTMINAAENFNMKPTNQTASAALQARTLITSHGRECAQAAMEALGGYSYCKKAGIERLYRDMMAGEFHPMQTGKQKEMLGRFLLGSTLAG